MRPHRRQPTRLPSPWESPGKNTGVGCHFLLQCMKMKSESEVAQSCLTVSNPMDCSLPGSFVHADSANWAKKGRNTHSLLQPELVPCWTPQPLLSLFPIVPGGFPDGSVVKDLPVNAGNVGSIPG